MNEKKKYPFAGRSSEEKLGGASSWDFVCSMIAPLLVIPIHILFYFFSFLSESDTRARVGDKQIVM